MLRRNFLTLAMSAVASSSAAAVFHDKANDCFIFRPEANSTEECRLDYHLLPNKANPTEVDFHHTYVSPIFRGKGYGEVIVKEGLQWTRDTKLNVKASCSYVEKIMRKPL